jgi:hypothetical protein
MPDTTTLLGVALVVAGVALVVYLKVVRPIQGDLASRRQGERIEKARRRRLMRHREA